MRRLRVGWVIALAMGLALFAAAGVRGGAHRVVVLPTSGIVDQVMAGYVRDGITRAHRDGAAAVLIRLDTPGGSVDATRDIVSSLLQAPLPVIVWVGPGGAQAASAGTFITLAGHVAVMAPGSNIGAATPISGEGEDIEGDLGKKVLNDSIAFITSIAQERGRNVDWAVETVRDARSSTAREALEVGAIDGLAGSEAEALAVAEGLEVTVAGQAVTLSLAGAATEELPMNPLQSFLHLLADPNIAFILFTVGFYGILFELQNPNFVTGILGGIAIILAFLGFGSLPLNVAGLLLVGLAIIMFALELTVTSHGLLAVAGLVCFALGASALYTEPGTPTAPDVSVAFPLLITMVVLTALFMGFVVLAAVRTQRLTPMAIGGGGAGGALPIGTGGLVRRPLDPVGSVYAAGEEWSARTAATEGWLDRDTPVRVVGQDGLILVVERAEPSGPGA